MREYNHFVLELRELKNNYSTKPLSEWNKQAIHSINGLASDKLRKLISLEDRRSNGAFFTDTELASAVINSYKLTFASKTNFYDPACGASNLLIAVKNHFEVKLSKRKIPFAVFGTDIHKEFIEASKLRLEICDLINGVTIDYSNNILVKDGLNANEFYRSATHIVTNPPFNLVDSNSDINWASGKVSAAAIFIDAILRNVNPGTEIIAILPDVLRSGSRYEKWRMHVSTYSTVTGIKLFGQFDNYADVDVFSVLLKKKKRPKLEVISPWKSDTDNTLKISDLFFVGVGTVVDNRDLNEGVKRPYIISKGLKGWTECNQTELTRRHKGKSVQSPFVVIKRTSRFGENDRAIATLISIPEQVFVDNHLIVLQPKEGGIETCRKLLDVLKMPCTSDWINSQIRCRHLTVKVVSNIPL